MVSIIIRLQYKKDVSSRYIVDGSSSVLNSKYNSYYDTALAVLVGGGVMRAAPPLVATLFLVTLHNVAISTIMTLSLMHTRPLYTEQKKKGILNSVLNYAIFIWI